MIAWERRFGELYLILHEGMNRSVGDDQFCCEHVDLRVPNDHAVDLSRLTVLKKKNVRQNWRV